MRLPCALVLAMMAAVARADESVVVCYNYGCHTEMPVLYSDNRLAWVRESLAGATTPERERELLALAVGRLYGWAAEQTPIGADRGGNYADDGQPGSMDCIDHSTTTDRFLHLFERRGWLRFHRVSNIVVRHRWIFGQHFTAVVEEKSGGARFAVDSWFVDNGEPAVILPLEDWENGGGPDD
jgi:hypothetical protein